MTGHVKLLDATCGVITRLLGLDLSWPDDFRRRVATDIAHHQTRPGDPYSTTFAALPDSPEPGDLGYPGAGQAVPVDGPRPDFDRPLVINHRQGCTGYCTCSEVPA